MLALITMGPSRNQHHMKLSTRDNNEPELLCLLLSSGANMQSEGLCFCSLLVFVFLAIEQLLSNKPAMCLKDIKTLHRCSLKLRWFCFGETAV